MAFLVRLFSCRHRHTYLERRELYGLQVMHLVCDCGHAVPVLERTEAEYRQIAFSQLKPLKATKFTPPSHAVGALAVHFDGLEVRKYDWDKALAETRRARG